MTFNTIKKVQIKLLLILSLFTLPVSLFAQGAQGTPLSPEAETIKRDIILTFNIFLRESGNSAAVEKLLTIQEISEYSNEKMAVLVPVYTDRLRIFESRISEMPNEDEKLLLTIFLERNIIDLSQDTVTKEEYRHAKELLKSLIKLSRSSLKDCSLVYSQLGGIYSFMITHERGGSFITKGPKLLRAYKKAYALDSKNFDALAGIALGDLFAPAILGGNLNKAIENFSIIIKETPYNTERFVAQVFMGVAFEKQGNREEAVKMWREADALFPGIIAAKFLRAVEIDEDPLAVIDQ